MREVTGQMSASYINYNAVTMMAD